MHQTFSLLLGKESFHLLPNFPSPVSTLLRSSSWKWLGLILQNKLKKQGSNIDFWKESQAQFSICLENFFSNKLPEMDKTYKRNITS